MRPERQPYVRTGERGTARRECSRPGGWGAIVATGRAREARCVIADGVTVDYVQAAGVRVGFECGGHGPPLVLLHGLPGDGRLWRRQLDDLSDKFMVVAWDAPGCGQLSDPPGPFGSSEVAQCLASFIEALELEQPHVLGLANSCRDQ